MRRCRWLLVLGLAVVTSGCSGTQLMGVALRDDGAVEVRSYCTNEGLTDATIRTDGGAVIAFSEPRPEPQEVIVFSADALAPLDADTVISVDGDYGGTGFFGESLTVRFGDLEPGTVVVSGLDPEVITLEEFENRRVSCGFSTTSLALAIAFVVGVLVVAAATVAAPILGVLIYVRRRRRADA